MESWKKLVSNSLDDPTALGVLAESALACSYTYADDGALPEINAKCSALLTAASAYNASAAIERQNSDAVNSRSDFAFALRAYTVASRVCRNDAERIKTYIGEARANLMR
jgi:hypothetical protein